MEAFVYLRVHPRSIVPVRNQLTSSAVARRSIVVIGDWDVLCLIDGPDLASILGCLVLMGCTSFADVRSAEGFLAFS